MSEPIFFRRRLLALSTAALVAPVAWASAGRAAGVEVDRSGKSVVRSSMAAAVSQVQRPVLVAPRSL